MKGLHVALTGLAIAAGLLVPVGIAQAATSTAPQQQTLTAPPAPTSVLSANAVAPTISPSVTTGHVAAGGTYNCPSGDLCALPWDPTTSSWKIFYLYVCKTYTLSNWNGNGVYLDNQSSNAVTYFYNQSHGVLTHFKPDYKQHSVDWTPVYYIKNC